MALFKTKTSEEKPAATAKKPAAKATLPKEDKKASMKDLYVGKDAKPITKKDGGAVARRGMAYKILVKPLVTEKAASQTVQGKYFFEVSDKANKIEIADAITEIYGIKPTGVNVVSVKGKTVRHGRINGQRKDWKKAIVTLPKGKTINIYEGV